MIKKLLLVGFFLCSIKAQAGDQVDLEAKDGFGFGSIREQVISEPKEFFDNLGTIKIKPQVFVGKFGNRLNQLSEVFAQHVPLYVSQVAEAPFFVSVKANAYDSLATHIKNIIKQLNQDVYLSTSTKTNSSVIAIFNPNTIKPNKFSSSGLVFSPNTKTLGVYAQAKQVSRTNGYDDWDDTDVPTRGRLRPMPSIQAQYVHDRQVNFSGDQSYVRMMDFWNEYCSQHDRESSCYSLRGHGPYEEFFYHWLFEMRESRRRMGQEVETIEQDMSDHAADLYAHINDLRLPQDKRAAYDRLITEFIDQLNKNTIDMKSNLEILNSAVPDDYLSCLNKSNLDFMFQAVCDGVKQAYEKKLSQDRKTNILEFALAKKNQAQRRAFSKPTFNPASYILPRSAQARAQCSDEQNTHYYTEALCLPNPGGHACFAQQESAVQSISKLDMIYGDVWGVYVHVGTGIEVLKAIMLGEQLKQMAAPINYVTLLNGELVSLSEEELVELMGNYIQVANLIDNINLLSIGRKDNPADDMKNHVLEEILQEPAKYMSFFAKS